MADTAKIKAKVLIDFVDFSVNRTRHVGDVFEVTEARFDEINKALAGHLEKYDGDVETVQSTEKSQKKVPAKKK